MNKLLLLQLQKTPVEKRVTFINTNGKKFVCYYPAENFDPAKIAEMAEKTGCKIKSIKNVY